MNPQRILHCTLQAPSIPCVFPFQVPTLPSLGYVKSHKRHVIHQRSCLSLNATATASSSTAGGGVFPGGTRRASLRLPGLGVRLRTDEILANSEAVKAMLDSAVAAGVNLVVLEDGKEDSLRVYDAARMIMSVLRGRADFFVVERVDIAAAAGASGVVLSDRGLPSVVARRMMQNAMPDAVVLPLVARRVTSSESAESATITEGADLLMLQVETSTSNTRLSERLVESICKRIKIPVFLESEVSLGSSAVTLLKAGASGLILGSLPTSGETNSLVSQLSSTPGLQTKSTLTVNGDGVGPGVLVPKTNSLEEQAKRIMEQEKVFCSSAIEVIREASPEMEEVELLVDALKQLDDLFLLVVVGEFNSGKSSVINALLGDQFLRQGVLPTTNEITLLKFSDESFEERPERHPDGHLMRYLSAELLKQMNLVDTPGTNVILQRQQRLTEEFVPRADLVMFVIGAERPLTESEVSFLRYIRRWDKKIIFALNKCDLLAEESEVADVMRFVKDNVRQLLNIEDALIYPISARKALRSKLKAMSANRTVDRNLLEHDPAWTTSGFAKLEQYVFDFLGGSSDAGAERIRLKLDTPLGIAAALFSACQKRVQADAAKVESDKRILSELDEQIIRFKELMANNVEIQIQRVTGSVAGATTRAFTFIDKTLQVTSVDTASKYLLTRKAALAADTSTFEREVIGSAFMDAKRAIEDYRYWMTTNTQRQLEKYVEIGNSRWPDTSSEVQLPEFSSQSLEALEGFDVQAANVLLEEEIREVVFSTFGSLGIAGASASFLTSVLPTTLEDLIALGLCSAGGLSSILKLSSLREGIKSKVEQVADSLSQKLEEAMRAELEESLNLLDRSVEQLTSPYRAAVEAESSRVISVQQKLLQADTELWLLRQRIQNLGS